MGDHICQLMLRPVGDIPRGLWSWRVYLDGNVISRGPGSKRKDPVHWYATLLLGEHRLVVRDSRTNNPSCKESNTLYFTVSNQTEIVVDVSFVNGGINLDYQSEFS